MPTLSPPTALTSSNSRRAVTLAAALAVIGVIVATPFDQALYHWSRDFGFRSTETLRPFYRLFPVVGSYSTWVLVAALFFAIDRDRLRGHPLRERLSRAKAMLLPGLCAGIATPVLKILVRRERPRDHHGEFFFRPYSDDFFSASGLGMPSGDAAIGFAGVFMLYRLVPFAWPIWFLLGCGCAFSRMIVGAHFLSDVLAGCALGILCAALVPVRTAHPIADRSGGRARAVAMACFFAALPLALFVISKRTAWQPAEARDIPGLYSATPAADPRYYYQFDPSGTYSGARLIEGDRPQLEHLSGTWSLDESGLRLGDAPPMTVETSGVWLRLTDANGPIVLLRD